MVNGSVEARDLYEEDEALQLRNQLLQNFAGTFQMSEPATNAEPASSTPSAIVWYKFS